MLAAATALQHRLRPCPQLTCPLPLSPLPQSGALPLQVLPKLSSNIGRASQGRKEENKG